MLDSHLLLSENNSIGIYWNRYTQCFHRCPGMSVSVIIPLFVYLLFLSHCSSFSIPSKKSCPEKAQPFLFTYLLTAYRDNSQKWSLAALRLVQSPFLVILQSRSKPAELGRKNRIVKLSMCVIMDEQILISNQFYFFCHLFSNS